jgi:hypothetical protein
MLLRELVRPAHDGSGVPRLTDESRIPEVTVPQGLWIPPEWIEERAT